MINNILLYKFTVHIQAAAEAEAATMTMAKRTFPDVSSIYEANSILRKKWLQTIEKHILQYSGNTAVNDVLDIGCSVGMSTSYLASQFPTANVVVSCEFNFLFY